MPDAADQESAQPELTAEMFDEVLERDLANIIRKAAHGQPLTQRERQMIEDERARLQTRREPAFHLEGGGAPSGALQGTQAEIAERYGYSVRAVKDWVRRGKEKQDPCPLKTPEQMPAWFERVYAPRQCPGRLQEAVQRLSAETKAEAPPPAAPAAARVEFDDSEKGIAAMLERARDNEATLYAKYQKAVDAEEENKATFLQKQWSDAAEKLRALEKTAPKTLEELGIYVRRDQVKRELVSLHAAILKAFEQSVRHARKRLRATETQGEWNAVARELVRECQELIVENDFGEHLELES